MRAMHRDQPPDSARRPAGLGLAAAGLLLAAVVLHVVAMFPPYFGGSIGQGSVWSQPDQLALFAVLTAGWALALALVLAGPPRIRLGAAVAVGLASTELGLRVADLGEALHFGVGQSSPGVWLMTAGWVTGAAGAVVAVLDVRRRARVDAVGADTTPAPGPVVMAAAAPSALPAPSAVPALPPAAVPAWAPQPDPRWASSREPGPQPRPGWATPGGPEPWPAAAAEPMSIRLDPALPNPWAPPPPLPGPAGEPSPPRVDPPPPNPWAPQPGEASMPSSHRVGPASPNPWAPPPPTPPPAGRDLQGGRDSADLPVRVEPTSPLPADATRTVPVESTSPLPVDATAAVPLQPAGAFGENTAPLLPADATEVVPAAALAASGPYGAGLTVLVAALALVTAGAFLPAWDRYVGVVTTTGRTVSFSLGNAFSGPWPLVLGNVLMALALAAVPIAATRLRDRTVAASAVVGSLLVLASQFTSAIVQANRPVPPSIAGLSSGQAAQLGLQLHLTLTGWFTLDVLAAYGLFVAVMVIGYLRPAPAHDNPVQENSAGIWPTTPEARSPASLPWS